MTPGWQGLTVKDNVAVPVRAGHQSHAGLVQQLGRHVQGNVRPVPEGRDFNATYRNIHYEAIMVQKCFIDLVLSWESFIKLLSDHGNIWYLRWHIFLIRQFVTNILMSSCYQMCCCHEPGWRNLRDHCRLHHRHIPPDRLIISWRNFISKMGI